MIELDARYDGSSKFPKDSRFQFFPTVSLGWRVSEEKFMEWSKDWLDNLGLAVPTTLDELDELKEIHGKQVEDYQKYLEEYNK